MRHLVTLHGGSVTAASPGPGLGCTFTVRLPLAAPVAGQSQDDKHPAHTAPAHPALRVLVADDNVDAADTLGDLLEAMGCQVLVTYDGEQAVNAATAFNPDLVFLDIGMPRLDGYGAARALRALPALAGVKLVALTGWGAQDDRARTGAAGFDHHLLKPASPDQVAVVLASATPASC